MKKEEGEKDIVGDPETNAAAPDNFKLEIGIHPTTSSQLRLEPCSLRVTGKVNLVPPEVEKFKALIENDLEKQHGSTSHAINIAKNERENASGYRWIKSKTMLMEKDNLTLVRELESYENQNVKEREGVKPKIQKVPAILRGVKYNEECYKPMIVGIGPYHHNKAELKEMNTFKIQFTLQYVFKSRKSIKELYEEMEPLLIDAKSYYTDEVSKCFNNKEFADMMFPDSCFVIQFMDSCVNLEMMNDIRITYLDTKLIMRDIMLLENQLPLHILTKLMSLSYGFDRGRGKEVINNFIKLTLRDTEEEAPRSKTPVWFFQTNSKLEGTSQKYKESIHLPELVKTKFVDDEEIKNGTSKKPSSNWCSFRLVKELKSGGINFQPSKSHRFSDITFNSMCFFGRLRLPRITIQDGTESLLLNLVAFETCADTSSNFGVSSYVYFMHTLINHAEDVKELRSKGIILNLLGSDEQIANLFKEISKNLVLDNRVFGIVKDSLNTFNRKYIHRRSWVTEFMHDHFRSPWTIIAFVAAVVVVCLTITQTVFSAIQL